MRNMQEEERAPLASTQVEGCGAHSISCLMTANLHNDMIWRKERLFSDCTFLGTSGLRPRGNPAFLVPLLTAVLRCPDQTVAPLQQNRLDFYKLFFQTFVFMCPVSLFQPWTGSLCSPHHRALQAFAKGLLSLRTGTEMPRQLLICNRN